MSRRIGQLSPQLHAYLLAHSAPADPVTRELADETARLFPGSAGMQIGSEQGTFMTLLARIPMSGTGGTWQESGAWCPGRRSMSSPYVRMVKG